MAYNRLETVPPSIGRLRRLKVLNLMGNELSALPQGLHRFQDLRRLNISMNHFAELPADLDTLTSLTDLRTAYNAMSAEEEASWERRFPLETPGVQGDLGLGS